MSEKNTTPAIFSKDNYTWMLIGLLAIAAGTAVGMLFNFHLARRFVFR